MPETPFDQAVANKWFAIELNNTTWDWLEEEDYHAPSAEVMVHAAHASCHHWLQVGGIANHARAECLVANVCAAVKDASSALRHARRCVELIKANSDEMADWDWAFAFDVLARAHAADGDLKQAAIVRMQAREYGRQVAEDADRAYFEKWHRAGSWHDLTDDA